MGFTDADNIFRPNSLRIASNVIVSKPFEPTKLATSIVLGIQIPVETLIALLKDNYNNVVKELYEAGYVSLGHFETLISQIHSCWQADQKQMSMWCLQTCVEYCANWSEKAPMSMRSSLPLGHMNEDALVKIQQDLMNLFSAGDEEFIRRAWPIYTGSGLPTRYMDAYTKFVVCLCSNPLYKSVICELIENTYEIKEKVSK
jgi:hypothetical protein